MDDPPGAFSLGEVGIRFAGRRPGKRGRGFRLAGGIGSRAANGSQVTPEGGGDEGQESTVVYAGARFPEGWGWFEPFHDALKMGWKLVQFSKNEKN